METRHVSPPILPPLVSVFSVVSYSVSGDCEKSSTLLPLLACWWFRYQLSLPADSVGVMAPYFTVQGKLNKEP